MCEFSLTPFLSLFSAFLPLSFTLRVWAFCCIYFSIPWRNDKDGGGEILWSAEQLLEKPLSAFFKHLISVPHQDLLSVLESFFFFFYGSFKARDLIRKNQPQLFTFPALFISFQQLFLSHTFTHLFPTWEERKKEWLISSLFLPKTGVVENIPQHDFNSAVYLWGWRGGYQIVHLTKPCQNLLFLSLATTFWNLCPRWYSSFLVWLLPVKVLLFCF